MIKKHCLITIAILFSTLLTAQHSIDDTKHDISGSSPASKSLITCEGPGLDGVIVEKYYLSDENDASDQTGGNLPAGSITYRIFLDLEEDYVLETVFGSPQHAMVFNTSTEFYNNAFVGSTTGNINEPLLEFNTVALDSWISFGSASSAHLGILKESDLDGSVIGGSNNDGGSESVAGGLLVNDDPIAGPALTISDGLISGESSNLVTVGDIGPQLSQYFGTSNQSGEMALLNGAYAVLGGVQGPTDANQILIAQVTTDGVFSFEINFRIGAPGGGYEQYVHSDPQIISGSDDQLELTCDDLTYVNDPSDPSGLSDLDAIQNFTLYPNPVKHNNLTIDISSLDAKKSLSYWIYDSMGKAVQAADIFSQRDGLIRVRLNDTMSSGLYLIMIQVDDTFMNQQFVLD